MPRRLLALLLAAPLAVAAASGPEPPAPASPDAPAAGARPREAEEPRTSWFALPILFWLPETKLGFGATGGLHFRPERARRASSVFLTAAYTLEHQGILDVSTDLYSRAGGILATQVRLAHFPDAFYGLGPDSKVSGRERFARRYAQAIASPEFSLLPGRLRAGPRLEARAEQVRDVEPGGLIASGAVPGADGFTAVGLGGTVTWDTRDNPLFPHGGSYAQAWALHYPGAIGSRHGTFTRGGLEGRTFLPVGGGRVLGLAAFLDHAFGPTPFTLLPLIGSARYLRGWREGRFRDDVAWAAQAELRAPLAGRLSAVAFAAVGGVAPSLGALRLDAIVTAAGAGLRWRLTPEGANLRLDLAASDAGVEVYVLVLEAF